MMISYAFFSSSIDINDLTYLKVYFRQMSQTKYFGKKNGKNMISNENIVKRHGGKSMKTSLFIEIYSVA